MELDRVYDTAKALIAKVETAKDAARKEVQKDLDLRTKEIGRLETKLAEAQSEVSDIQDDYTAKSRELKQLKSSLESSQKTAEDATARAETLQAALADKDELLTQYKKTAESYADAAANAEKLEKENTNLVAQLAKLQQTVSDQTQQIHNLEQANHQYLLEKPLRADIALIKATKADKAGNLNFRMTSRATNSYMALAADLVIAEVEDLVEIGELGPDEIDVPAPIVDMIVVRQGEKKPFCPMWQRAKAKAEAGGKK